MDLRLETRKQAQRDEVGHGNGEHVRPDDAGHHVAVQQQGCGRPAASGGRTPKRPQPAGTPPALRAQTRHGTPGPSPPHLGRRASCAWFSAEAHQSACRLPRRRSPRGLGCPSGTRRWPGLGPGAPGGGTGWDAFGLEVPAGSRRPLPRRPANTPSSAHAPEPLRVRFPLPTPPRPAPPPRLSCGSSHPSARLRSQPRATRGPSVTIKGAPVSDVGLVSAGLWLRAVSGAPQLPRMAPGGPAGEATGVGHHTGGVGRLRPQVWAVTARGPQASGAWCHQGMKPWSTGRRRARG